MKILHLPDGYLPWATGGREVYCHSLCGALAAQGVAGAVAIHQDPAGRAPLGRQEHEGVPVWVLPPLPEYGSRRAWATREFREIPGFEALLAEVRPDAVHFHDQGGGASLSHLRAVKARGLPAVLTCHSPGQTCPQTELLRRGLVPCDGEVRLRRCTCCRLGASGVPRWAGDLLALAEWPGADPWSPSPLSRVLSSRATIRMFRGALREYIRLADAIVVLAEWSRELWLRNGCPPGKLRLVRTGGPARTAPPPRAGRPPGAPLRVVCLGRCDRTKGFHVLVDAVRARPELAVEVQFLGPYWDGDYGRGLREKMGADPRFPPPRLVPNGQIAAELAGADLVAIPSIWLETGPLTLFDAFAAGVPVVASRLGGIAETVRDGVDGRLFPPGDARALGEILAEIAGDRAGLEVLRGGVPREGAAVLRTFREIAGDMARIYAEVGAGAGEPVLP